MSPAMDGRGVQHHPSDATLAGYAAGSLGRLPGIVVATHLSFCASCRTTAQVAETVGGMLLEELPPTPLGPAALDRTLARLAAPEPRPAEEQVPIRLGPHAAAWPSPLDGLQLGKFRWLAPGIRFAELLRSGDELLGVLRLRAGVEVAPHAHSGTELTCVLEGAYRDDTGFYRPGDLEEASRQLRHRPVAEGPGDCVCLVAARGRVRFANLLGRLWQPFQPF